jgi:hypothetical protein
MKQNIQVYLSVDGSRDETVLIRPDLSYSDAKSVFYSAAGLGAGKSGVTLKLYSKENVMLPIGPHTPGNNPDSRYKLVVKACEC